jgi:rRNA maturation RNase YbeY
MINIQVNTKISPALNEGLIFHIASLTLEYIGLEANDLTVVIGNNAQIQDLNNTYRDINESTDVLSFTSDEVNLDTGKRYLGDIIISFPKVKSQSIEQNHSVQTELATLIIHGILHLAGYDHSNAVEEKEMFDLQTQILDKLTPDLLFIKPQSFLDSIMSASNGLVAAVRTERNVIFHLVAGLLATGLGVVLKIRALEWAILTIVIVNVFTAELINTSLEFVVNFASPEKNEFARKAKDVSAAAVFIQAIASVLIGMIIFMPKIVNMLLHRIN